MPNVEVCIALPSGGGYCNYTLDDREQYVSKENWMEFQVGRMSMSVEGFAEYQKFIEQTCTKYGCTEEEKKAQAKMLTEMKRLKNGFRNN